MIKSIKNHCPRRKKVRNDHDNAPVHTSDKVMTKLNRLIVEILSHSSYPDLIPSDYRLILNLRKGRKFYSNEEIK